MKELLIVKQILLVGTARNIKETVWRTWELTYGFNMTLKSD